MTPQKVHPRRSLVAFLAPLALAAGCATSPVDQDPNMSVRQEHDISVPQQFVFDKDNSWSYIPYTDPQSEGYFRSTRSIYYGDQQIGPLIPVLKDDMEKDGWTSKESRFEDGKQWMTFTKRDETATIQIYRQFDTRFDRHMTFIVADVHPTPTEAVAVEDILKSAESPGLGIPEKKGAAPAGSRNSNEAEAAPRQAGGPGVIQAAPAPRKDRVAIPAIEDEETEGVPAPSSARTEKIPLPDNKQVVNEKPEGENEGSSSSGEEVTPDDEGSN